MRRATRSQRLAVTGTASLASLRPMLAYARQVGIDVDALLHEVGLQPARLSEFDLRIPEELHTRVWMEASRRSGDPAFGVHFGAASRITDFDVVGYAVSFSATL